MPTSFALFSTELFSFATGVLAAGRLGTSDQISRHHSLSGRSQPQKRAREFLSAQPAVFEKIHGIYPHSWVWRLTREYKRAHGLAYRNVGASQRLPHWLAFGDLFIDLVQNGYRPQKWFTEGRLIGGFDIFMTVHDVPYLIELQRTELSQREWRQKWYRRQEWWKTEPWKEEKWQETFSRGQPHILLITTQRMKNVQLPKSGVMYIPQIAQVHNYLQRLEQKKSLHR